MLENVFFLERYVDYSIFYMVTCAINAVQVSRLEVVYTVLRYVALLCSALHCTVLHCAVLLNRKHGCT